VGVEAPGTGRTARSYLTSVRSQASLGSAASRAARRTGRARPRSGPLAPERQASSAVLSRADIRARVQPRFATRPGFRRRAGAFPLDTSNPRPLHASSAGR